MPRLLNVGKALMGKRVIKKLSGVMIFGLAFILALIINRFVIFKVEVPTGSMERTIMTGDKVFTPVCHIYSDRSEETCGGISFTR